MVEKGSDHLAGSSSTGKRIEVILNAGGSAKFSVTLRNETAMDLIKQLQYANSNNSCALAIAMVAEPYQYMLSNACGCKVEADQNWMNDVAQIYDSDGRKMLPWNQPLNDLVNEGARVHFLFKNYAGGIPNASIDLYSAIFYSLDHTDRIELETCRLSCRSDYLVRGEDYVGMMLLKYKNMSTWQLNGVHCKSGYVYIKKACNLTGVSSAKNTLHAKLYKSLFNVDIEERDIIATGFSYQQNKFAFRSTTFNTADDKYHDDDREGSAVEAKLILMTMIHFLQTNERTMEVSKHFCALAPSRRATCTHFVEDALEMEGFLIKLLERFESKN